MTIDQAIAYANGGGSMYSSFGFPWPSVGTDGKTVMKPVLFVRDRNGVRALSCIDLEVRRIYLGLVAATKRRVNMYRWMEWHHKITKYERHEYGESANAMLRHLRTLAR